MEYSLHHESYDMSLSVHSFPGDELIEPGQYRAIMSGGYISTATTIAGAAESFGIDLDTETFERWKRTVVAMGYLDNLLDESEDRIYGYEVYQDLVASLKNQNVNDFDSERVDEVTITSVNLLRNSVRALPEDQLDCCLMAAVYIGAISWAKQESSAFEEYSVLLQHEAHFTGDILTTASSSYVRSQHSFEELDRWIHEAVEAATYVCAARDIKEDYRHEIMSVEPSVVNGIKLALQAQYSAQVLIQSRRNMYATFNSLWSRSKFGRL